MGTSRWFPTRGIIPSLGLFLASFALAQDVLDHAGV